MKLKRIQNPKHKKVQKLMKVVFPVVGILAFWNFVHRVDPDTKIFRLKDQKKSKTFFGLVAATSLFWWGKKFFHLNALSIAPDHQGLGLGTQALEALEKKAQDSGHSYIFFTSHPKRTTAHKLYLKHGFKRLFGFLFWKKIQ